ncbi:MAG: polymorphic toxin type 50 domain-containing protein [Defluviitaleaceae bacterium]|nr:polymorphic toxin type 50 domain-containing protein [Defluviitaleaceae bacterium]
MQLWKYLSKNVKIVDIDGTVFTGLVACYTTAIDDPDGIPSIEIRETPQSDSLIGFTAKEIANIEIIKTDGDPNKPPQIKRQRIKGVRIIKPSYILNGVDPQALVDKYHGTGLLKMTRKGEWDKEETIISDKLIGVDINSDTGVKTPTNCFKIHYSEDGVYIVPTVLVG